MKIHVEPRIEWQGPFAHKMATGLRAIGIEPELTTSRTRLDDDPAIVLGTTLWREVEATGKYLLVDRCSFGDTNKYVSLVWDGHGRRGNHCVPDNYSFSRWTTHGVELAPFTKGTKVVLCGQAEAYCGRDLHDWYRHAPATHFRPHPAAPVNPTLLPEWKSWKDVGLVLTLNSSVAIDALVNGVEANVADEGGMAFGWNRYCIHHEDARTDLMRWLAWTQWHHDEIAEGFPIEHIFDSL